MTIGQKVKTNNYYERMTSHFHFLTFNPIVAGTITALRQVDNYLIAEVKLRNGKSRSINVDFLEAFE